MMSMWQMKALVYSEGLGLWWMILGSRSRENHPGGVLYTFYGPTCLEALRSFEGCATMVQWPSLVRSRRCTLGHSRATAGSGKIFSHVPSADHALETA